MKTKGSILLFVTLGVLLLMTACRTTSTRTHSTKQTIGIAMPSKAVERWDKDGRFMVEFLEKADYQTDLQYAQDDVPTQVSQIENMITKDVSAIVIAAVDGESLTDVIAKAQKAKIPVLAYDRLIMNSDGVAYYATFDNFQVGVLQGTYLVEQLDLANQKEPRYLEVFGGAPDDNNSHFFFGGAYSVLEPYLKEGTLVIKSGQEEFTQIATNNWDGAVAQARMDNLLSAYYADEPVHGILAPNDTLATGIISSLKGVGYGSATRPMPVITGQDAEVAAVKAIIKGDQGMTVFKNTQSLAKVAATMIDNLLNAQEVAVNDQETYHNNVKIVPTFMLKPEVVTAQNYQELLLDSGYLTQAELD